MPFDNPFRENRLNTSRNFRPEWDVPELNQAITKWLVEEVRRLRGRTEPDSGQMIITMTGPPGYGKTHLFGRIEHLVGHDVFFVFVPAFEPRTAPLDHIRWHVLDALFRVPDGGHSPLEMSLARICQPAFVNYFGDLPPTLANRHDTMHRRLGEFPGAALEIVRLIKSLPPFLKLAASLTQVFLEQDVSIVRALALGWAPAPWSANARRWLQGQDLPDADREALGLGEDAPGALEVLSTIPVLFGHQKPMMICCDQIESLLQGNSSETVSRFSSAMMDLLHRVPAQLVLSCFEDQLDKLYKNAFAAFKMRVRQPSFLLDDLGPDQAIRLVKTRIASWSGREADRPPTWPFEEASIARFIGKSAPTPRGLIQECDKKLDSWNDDGRVGEIRLDGDKGDVSRDLEALFVREWNQETQEISQTASRSAAELPEDRLYRGILEVLKLAHSAQRLREFGGSRIVDVRDKAIKSSSAARRPGAYVTLAAGPGQESQTILVALTQLEASTKLVHYFKALLDASTDPVAGALLIHPRRDLNLGASTRASFDNAVKAGKLRVMALEDYPLTYHSSECMAAMLDRANARELVLNGVTLSAEDCRDLIIKTRLIDNLDLFKMLGQWKRPAAKPVARVVEGSGLHAKTSSQSQTVVETTLTDHATSPPYQVPRTADVIGPEAHVNGISLTTNLNAWAAKMLTDAVRKLNLLGQAVKPDGFEIGPTFARLRVQPDGKTNFKAVSNKAIDLRISLGLEVAPIVGSQAGCISIDIQRPDRVSVSILDALTDCPKVLDGMPAFPVGMDVGGQTHWLNLAEPSDCHLLVAGTTGSGKSELLRSIIGGLATRLPPDKVQFALIDPKRVTFNFQGNSSYLRFPVVRDLSGALPMLEKCMTEMDRRYSVLTKQQKSDVSELSADLLPRIVIVIDEFASFLEDKESKRVVTALLKRIGAMARAAGIHLIVSTQRPDKDVITPLLRDNLPGRIALRVASRAGSDLILGAPDAEHLLGRGDLFWKKSGELLRLQSPFISPADLAQALRCKP